MVDPSNDDDSSPAGNGSWPPAPASGNGYPFGGPESWATPWDYGANGPLLYGPLAKEAIIYGLPDFARAARYYAAARDAADPDRNFGVGQSDWAKYSSGANLGVDASGNSESAGAGANEPSAIPSYSPASPVYDDYAGIPDWKRGFLRRNKQAQPWIDFNQAMGYLPGVGANEKNAYREIFAAEGGTMPDGDTVAGITPQTISDLYSAGKLGGWAASTRPEDLTPSRQVQVYRVYMDDALSKAGGYSALEDISHPGVAAFVGDTLFREGPKGVGMIQGAINDVLGPNTVASDNVFGADTLKRLNEAIQTPEGRQAFADSLQQNRDQAHNKKSPNFEGEALRVRHFYDLSTD